MLTVTVIVVMAAVAPGGGAGDVVNSESLTQWEVVDCGDKS
jgi:hypothetical protein